MAPPQPGYARRAAEPEGAARGGHLRRGNRCAPRRGGGARGVSFEHARKIADAVLYEGYVLYPYRASARKNRLRWQFGVLAPRTWSEAGGGEAWWMQTTCLLSPGAATHLTGRIRFLHVLARTVEALADAGSETFGPVESLDVGGRLWASWDEGVEREVDFDEPVPLAGGGAERAIPFSFPDDRRVESIRDEQARLAGRVVRTQRPLEGVIRVSVDRVAASRPLLAVRIRIENLTPFDTPGAPREQALGAFLVGTHTLLA